MFSLLPALNDNLANGQIAFEVIDGEPYVKVGADSVPKKLGNGTPERTQIFSGNSTEAHTVDVSSYPGYQHFTLDNFCIRNANLKYVNGTHKGSVIGDIIGSYNATSGILNLNKSTSYYQNYYFYVEYAIDLVIT